VKVTLTPTEAKEIIELVDWQLYLDAGTIKFGKEQGVRNLDRHSRGEYDEAKARIPRLNSIMVKLGGKPA